MLFYLKLNLIHIYHDTINYKINSDVVTTNGICKVFYMFCTTFASWPQHFFCSNFFPSLFFGTFFSNGRHAQADYITFFLMSDLGFKCQQKKMSWKNEKYNLFDWKAQVQCILVDGKTLEILHTLFWGWLDIDVVTKKAGEMEIKKRWKKAEMKKGRKKFNGWSGQCFSLHNHVYRPKII